MGPALAPRNVLAPAVFFFPIVKRLSVDLMNRRLCDVHFPRLSGQKEINVVGLPVCTFPIAAGEVFPPAEILQPIVVDFYQVEGQILTFVFDVELAVTALFAFSVDVFLDAGRNISRAGMFFLPTFFRVFPAFLWMFWMLLGKDQRRWCEE